jgi:hypothetical protein
MSPYRVPRVGVSLHSAHHTRVGGRQSWRVTPIDILHLAASVLPHVRDPWPSNVGLELPFTAAGAGEIVGAAFSTSAEADERNRTAHKAATRCFSAGGLFYLVALLNQLTFQM